ncbi:unnamed protein product [Trichobilharzia regenti]|nr:unnamed protein product [Trichobilharzia regenti]
MGRKPAHGKRYHLADSLKLRKALGLGRHDIPIHIYRMRSLGYPPGWLKKAAVSGNLEIFDSVSLEGSTGPSKLYMKSSTIWIPFDAFFVISEIFRDYFNIVKINFVS